MKTNNKKEKLNFKRTVREFLLIQAELNSQGKVLSPEQVKKLLFELK